MTTPQFPPETILVPVDFSEASVRAWNFAQRLAKRFHAKVEAVHVSRIVYGPEITWPPLSPGERAELKRTMARTFADAAALHVEEGDIPLGILRTARRRHAGLIVMSTAGRTGLKRLMVPSVAEDVVRSSNLPVLILHGEEARLDSVLAPVNLKPYSLEGMRFAGRVADALGAELSILLVREADTLRPLAARRLELAAADLRCSKPVETDVVEGEVLEKILEASSSHGLLVMAVHRKGVFHDAVLGSTAEQVLRRARVPVLTVPPIGVIQRRSKMEPARGRGEVSRRTARRAWRGQAASSWPRRAC